MQRLNFFNQYNIMIWIDTFRVIVKKENKGNEEYLVKGRFSFDDQKELDQFGDDLLKVFVRNFDNEKVTIEATMAISDRPNRSQANVNDLINARINPRLVDPGKHEKYEEIETDENETKS